MEVIKWHTKSVDKELKQTIENKIRILDYIPWQIILTKALIQRDVCDSALIIDLNIKRNENYNW